MGVNIRENNRYKELVRSLVQKNITSDNRNEGHIKGIFSTLAKWRDEKIFEETEIDLKRKFALSHASTRARREIEAKWMKILIRLPRPKFIN